MGNKLYRGLLAKAIKRRNETSSTLDSVPSQDALNTSNGDSTSVEDNSVHTKPMDTPAPVPIKSAWSKPAEKRMDSKAYAAEVMKAKYGMSNAQVEKAKNVIGYLTPPDTPPFGSGARARKFKRKTEEGNETNSTAKSPQPSPPAPRKPTKEEIYCIDAQVPAPKAGMHWASLGKRILGESTEYPSLTNAQKLRRIHEMNEKR